MTNKYVEKEIFLFSKNCTVIKLSFRRCGCVAQVLAVLSSLNAHRTVAQPQEKDGWQSLCARRE